WSNRSPASIPARRSSRTARHHASGRSRRSRMVLHHSG
ncbi:MAG: hypothetical protein AVDCRST_MAG93-131, partial [uncultured Chloroflexia bacterium]